MPNQPKPPQRTIRLGDELWAAARTKAASEGRTISDVVREALEIYVGKVSRHPDD